MPRTGNRRADDPQAHSFFRRAVNDELKGRGYTLVPAAEAEVHIDYVISVDVGRQAYTQVATDYEEGRILFDVFRAGEETPVWRREATARLLDPSTNLQTAEARIREAVEMMLAPVPPRAATPTS